MTRSISVRDARRGDILTFPDPEGRSLMITHRVLRAELIGATVDLATRGDANSVSERWSVGANVPVRRVILRVPSAGYLLAFLSSPLGLMALVVLPALTLGAYTLFRIWTPRPRREHDDG
jgi:signal peptidase I